MFYHWLDCIIQWLKFHHLPNVVYVLLVIADSQVLSLPAEDEQWSW